MAPDAKLAFTDLGSNGTDGIFTPEDLSTDYFPYAYGVGARVHSDSWGSSSVQYDYLASEVDLFTWQNQVRTETQEIPYCARSNRARPQHACKHQLLPNFISAAHQIYTPPAQACSVTCQCCCCVQDFTAVFAAGNEGLASASNSQGASTVSSPATSKNCIAAGATEIAGQASASNSQYVTAEMSVSQPVNGSGADTTVESYMVRSWSSAKGSVSQDGNVSGNPRWLLRGERFY